MQQDVFYYFQKIAHKLKKQDDKINELEKQQKQMTEELEQLRSQQAVHVDRIDYHFDQLKIERLDGTLNIGINPADLQNADEFSIGQHPFQSIPFTRNEEMMSEIEKELDYFLENSLIELISREKETRKIEMDESYFDFMKQDILKQLPGRIEYYMQRVWQEHPDFKDDDRKKWIVDSIQKDIIKAVDAFLNQFTEKGGGDRT